MSSTVLSWKGTEPSYEDIWDRAAPSKGLAPSLALWGLLRWQLSRTLTSE